MINAVSSTLTRVRTSRVDVLCDARLETWHEWILCAFARDGVEVRLLHSTTPPRRRLPLLPRAWRPVSRERAAQFEASAPDASAVPAAILDLRRGPQAGAAPSRHGLWRFRLGEGSQRAPLVREIGAGRRSFPVALERLDPLSGKPLVLRSGRFKVHYSYASSLDKALRDAAEWPALALRLLEAGIEPLPGEPPQAAAPEPGPLAFAAFLGRSIFNFVRTAAEYAFVEAHWNIGLAKAAPQSFLGPAPHVQWLPSQERYFVADPALVRRGERAEIFCEFYEYARHKGTIAFSAVENGRASDWQTVLETPRHMSYPYVFAHDGVTYCVPEDYRSNEIALYRARVYPHEWEKVAVLVEGVAGLDPTIFRHDGRWWLLATRADRESNTNLFAWFADDLRGTWREHPANPVKTDVTSARPAGNPFVHEGSLYRPGQDSSRSYGGGLAVNRIVTLTPTHFVEEVAARVEPIAPYSDGIHTLSSDGGWTAVDCRRDVWTARKLRRALARRGQFAFIRSRWPIMRGQKKPNEPSATKP